MRARVINERMFSEIEGGTQMQPTKIGDACEQSLRTPGLNYLTQRLITSHNVGLHFVAQNEIIILN